MQEKIYDWLVAAARRLPVCVDGAVHRYIFKLWGIRPQRFSVCHLKNGGGLSFEYIFRTPES